MKLYLKIIFPLFVTVLVYTFLVFFFGSRGIFATCHLDNQKESLVAHIKNLSDMGNNLSANLKNLSSDPDTIALYAHELGYVSAGENLIRVLNFSEGSEPTYEAGSLFLIEPPVFISDTLCKSMAVSAGIIIILCEMLFRKKNGYNKRAY